MINIVALVGRLARDPEITYTQGGMSISKFTVAVDRRFKSDGQPTADFIRCVAFGKTAEFIEKWFHKGDPISLGGHIQTGSYTNNDGQKVYTTDVICDQVSFVPGRSERQPESADEKPVIADGFLSVPEDADEQNGLPFK